MSQPMEECQNCGKMFPQSKIPTHFGYCRRNIKKCNKCGQMYDINFQQEHQEQFHKKTPCPHCKETFLASDFQKHVNSCDKKPKYCQYCQQMIPILDFPSHLRICESRTKPCQKCNKAITNKEYFIHLSTCQGIVEEPKPPKNYDQYIDNHQKIKRKEQSKKQYTNIVYNPQRREKKQQPKYQKKPQIKRQKNQILRKPEIKQQIKRQKNQIFQKPQIKQEIKPEKIKFSYPNKPNISGSNKNHGGINNRNPQIKPKEPIQANVRPKKPIELPRIFQKKERKKNWQQEYINDIQFDEKNNQHNFPQQKFEDYNNINNMNKQIQDLNFNPGVNQNQGMMDEDQELQKAILMSMGQKKQKKKVVPAELENQQLMNTSFYHDIDYEKQKALMQEFSKKKKR